MKTEAELQDQAVNINPIPLHFGVYVNPNWNETGVAWIAIQTPIKSDPLESNTVYETAVFSQTDAQTLTTQLNAQLQKEILDKYKILVNFSSIQDPQKKGGKSFNVVFQVINNPWQRTEKNKENEKLLLAVQIANSLNEKSLSI